MGELIRISEVKCVGLKLRRWENERNYREINVFVGPFKNTERAQEWHTRLVNILDIDGEINVAKVLVGPVPWTWLRNKGRILVRPYDKDGETLWTFVHSLEDAIRQCELKVFQKKEKVQIREVLSLPKPRT